MVRGGEGRVVRGGWTEGKGWEWGKEVRGKWWEWGKEVRWEDSGYNSATRDCNDLIISQFTNLG